MLYLAIMFVFVATLFFTYFILITVNDTKIQMAQRVASIENMDKAWIREENEYGESVASVILKGLGSFLLKFSPSYKSSRNKKMLEKAGVLRETTYEKFVARKAVFMAITATFSIVITLILTGNVGNALTLAIVTSFLIHMIYRFLISKKITKRTQEIVKSLPYSLDLITVSVEAGLSLDGSIGRIVSNIEGPLSEEFGQTLKEMRMGIEKKDALKAMSERVGNKDLSMLLSSMIQADELGVSLGKILRIEGDQLREKRKQTAKEKAMKAPIKMLFPLMIFIFPTIFVIILGPAFIQMANVL
ncbi:MAG: type II secretion system F family protein [Clostridia bacterium]|nr:type II secretion system F family protein [Clostridia bacterium]